MILWVKGLKSFNYSSLRGATGEAGAYWDVIFFLFDLQSLEVHERSQASSCIFRTGKVSYKTTLCKQRGVRSEKEPQA